MLFQRSSQALVCEEVGLHEGETERREDSAQGRGRQEEILPDDAPDLEMEKALMTTGV